LLDDHLLLHSFFILITPPLPRSTLFPYTTLFRSLRAAHALRAAVQDDLAHLLALRHAAVRLGGLGEWEDVVHQRPDALARHQERSEEHTSELQSPDHLVCRLLLEKKKKSTTNNTT